MEANKKIKVIFVDDQLTVLDGYKSRLGNVRLQKSMNVSIDILGGFQDDKALFQYLGNEKNTKPDIILLDMEFRNMGEPSGGLRITKEIRHKFHNSIKIIIVSGVYDFPEDSSSYTKETDIKKIISDNSKVIANAINEGANGFISRNPKNYYEDILRGIGCISSGEEYFFNAPIIKTVVAAFLQFVKQEGAFIDPLIRANHFELDSIDLSILKMLAKGMKAVDIAKELAKNFGREKYSEKSVQQRQSKIADRLDVANNSNVIIVKAIKEGLIVLNRIEV